MRGLRANHSDAHGYQLELDIRVVLLCENLVRYLLLARFNLGPAVDFDSEVLLDNVGVGVANRNCGALLHDFELLIRSDELAAAVLVSNQALGHLVNFLAVVALSLANDLDRVDAEVHVDARARLQIAHVGELGIEIKLLKDR